MLNSVAHTDPIFNDTLETKPRRKGGRPRKQPITQLIDGFPICIAQSAYFNIPCVFMDIIAAIDNLAELKVVMYILRHTWGFREFNAPLRITTDEFMHGRFKKDGTRMDSGTGLSKSAVLDGLERAKKHGFIECSVDDRDRARVEHYYRLKIQSEESSETPEKVTTFGKSEIAPSDDPVTQIVTTVTFEDQQIDKQEAEEYDPYADTIFSKNYQSPEQKIFASESDLKTTSLEVNNYPTGNKQLHRTHKRISESTSLTNDIRNVHPSKNLEEAIRYLPKEDQLPKPKQKSPAFIRNMLTDFSRDLGDQDHTFSNISQATRLYRDCGATEETFMQALYDARSLAKKATQIRHLNSFGNPNRMPYFFRCLTGALKQETAHYTA